LDRSLRKRIRPSTFICVALGLLAIFFFVFATSSYADSGFVTNLVYEALAWSSLALAVLVFIVATALRRL
jgi:hypothetical protein